MSNYIHRGGSEDDPQFHDTDFSRHWRISPAEMLKFELDELAGEYDWSEILDALASLMADAEDLRLDEQDRIKLATAARLLCGISEYLKMWVPAYREAIIAAQDGPQEATGSP